MRVIDAFTGHDVHVGDVVPSPVQGESWKLLSVDDQSFFRARVRIRLTHSGREFWSPLNVRILHPSFLFQRVGFVES